MKKGWYILNYHDVSWEESAFIRAVGDSFPPDIFAEHVHELGKRFELVSVQEGWQRLHAGKVDGPLLSFWFDDGFLGVRKYAYPILEAAGVKAAIAINSSFMLRREFYWRLKLSYLAHVDGLRFLRQRLRQFGYKTGESVRSFTLNNCSQEIIDLIDELFTRFTTEHTRKDVFRHFDTVEGLRFLRDQGWELSNHTAAHYPVSGETGFQSFEQQFGECERELNQAFDLTSKYWVLPFASPFDEPGKTQQRFEAVESDERVMVYVGSKINVNPELHQRRLSRILLPVAGTRALLKTLGGLQAFAAP